MSLELSLYTIESDLSNLIEMREQIEADCSAIGIASEALDDAMHALAVIDEQITAYIRQEVVKVDNIRSFWRHCELMRDAAKEEARVQSDRSKVWASRLDRLKETCRSVMETIPFPAGKLRKLEGRTGSLLLKANGGKQAVEITDESLVPDEMVFVTVQIRADCLGVLDLCHEERDGKVKIGPRVPSLSLITEALGKPCERCKGAKRICFEETQLGEWWDICPECGGSGHQSVPGCRLSPRSNHVECK